MLVTIDMPAVAECEVVDCSYNRENKCHARGITIGDMRSPGCDTYLAGGQHTSETNRIAGVGACKVVSCSYNDDLECEADQIKVGRTGNEVLCRTFSKR